MTDWFFFLLTFVHVSELQWNTNLTGMNNVLKLEADMIWKKTFFLINVDSLCVLLIIAASTSAGVRHFDHSLSWDDDDDDDDTHSFSRALRPPNEWFLTTEILLLLRILRRENKHRKNPYTDQLWIFFRVYTNTHKQQSRRFIWHEACRKFPDGL